MIEITLFTKSGGPLTKRIFLNPDGKVVSDGSQCLMAHGFAERFVFSQMRELAELEVRLTSRQAIATGAMRGDQGRKAEVVSKRKLNGASRPGVITRSQEFFENPAGKPGVVLVDFDNKGMPADVAKRLSQLGGLVAALATICPGFADAGRLERASTSAGIYNADTDERYPHSGGSHVKVKVADCSDNERFLKTLHQRCWLAGLGWMRVGEAGQLLELSIVDKVCGGPERLVFEGPPDLAHPLLQDASARQPIVVEGGALDTIAACPPLNIAELAKYTELRAKERQRLAGDADKARDAFIAGRSRELVKRTGMDLRRARKVIERQCEGVLLPDVVLPFDDPQLAGTTVADVLADPGRFEGETLADPLEGIQYGLCKARVMRRADGSVWIHSFAHGRTIYELRLDFAAAKAELQAATPDDSPDVFVRLVLAADLQLAEIERLKQLAAKKSDVGVRSLAAMLKLALQQRAAERKREEDARRIAERRDPRPQLPVPAADAEWLPQMGAINAVLAASRASEPPTRDFEGFLNLCRSSRPPGLHSLTSAGANAGQAQADRVPAPEQFRLARLDEVDVSELIERHIEYVDPQGSPVHLPSIFVKHYFKRREDPALPRAYTIVQMPLVLPSGEILTGQGLNRDMNAIFRVPTTLQIPDRQDCTDSRVSAAMRFLTDDWLCDVNTDYAGKCVIIGLTETIIERPLLPLRPGFYVVGDKRGGGKTTTLNMVSTAALGTVAPAAAWSPNEEERRKALFSYFLEDDPFIVFDNIKRGATIHCPHVERALTAEFFADRVLGASERRIVPITTVFAWTGNKIAPRGDTSSRVLRTLISVDRPDPENREFRHADPIGWTAANPGGSSVRSTQFCLVTRGALSRQANAVQSPRASRRGGILSGRPLNTAQNSASPKIARLSPIRTSGAPPPTSASPSCSSTARTTTRKPPGLPSFWCLWANAGPADLWPATSPPTSPPMTSRHTIRRARCKAASNARPANRSVP